MKDIQIIITVLRGMIKENGDCRKQVPTIVTGQNQAICRLARMRRTLEGGICIARCDLG